MVVDRSAQQMTRSNNHSDHNRRGQRRPEPGQPVSTNSRKCREATIPRAASRATGRYHSRWCEGRMGAMDVLSSRTLLRPSEPSRSHRFYRDTLGLAIYREFGSPDAPGLVFFLGNGLLEVSGRATIRRATRSRCGSKSGMCMPSIGGCWTPAYRFSADLGARRGDWWRCGSRILMECRSSCSKSRTTIRCGETNAAWPLWMNRS